MDQLEDLVKDFQTPKVAKVNLKALRDRDEASGRLVVDAFTPRFVDLEQRLDRLERNSRKTFRRTVLAGIIGGFGAAALWAAASYLLKRYVITPDTTPATTPTTTAHKSHNASNDMATPLEIVSTWIKAPEARAEAPAPASQPLPSCHQSEHRRPRCPPWSQLQHLPRRSRSRRPKNLRAPTG